MGNRQLVPIPPIPNPALQSVEGNRISQLTLSESECSWPIPEYRHRVGGHQQLVCRGVVIHQERNTAAAEAFPEPEGIEVAIPLRRQRKHAGEQGGAVVRQ
jgi:hypothetical protein